MPVATSPIAESFRSDISTPGSVHSMNSMHLSSSHTPGPDDMIHFHHHPHHGHPQFFSGAPGPGPRMVQFRRGPSLPPPGMLPGGPGGVPQVPFLSQPECRIHDMNRRLQHPRLEECDNLWWDQFATEFFEDDGRIVITMGMEGEGPGAPSRRYTVGRTLIPRFFRSYFEGGVVELQFELHHPRESFQNSQIFLDCDTAVQLTTHCKPTYARVFTEGRLFIQFTNDELMRIRSWMFAIRGHQEFIPRNILAMQHDPVLLEHHSKNITISGLHMATLNFLRLCVILEPMQELMSRNKAYQMQPRECLTSILFEKWKQTIGPPGIPLVPCMQPLTPVPDSEAARGTAKRRKRKASGGRGAANNVNAQNGPLTGGPNAGNGISGGPVPLPASKKGKGGGGGGGGAPATPGMPLASQDVMIVGEPTLMGGDFGDEDERLITRLENTQYDPSLAAQLAQQQQRPPGDRKNDESCANLIASAAVHNDSLHYSSSSSSPRGPIPGHGPPSVGSWQQNRPASATSTTPNTNGDGKNRSPNN